MNISIFYEKKLFHDINWDIFFFKPPTNIWKKLMTNGLCALLVNLISVMLQNSDYECMGQSVNDGLSRTAYLNWIHALNPLFYWLLQLLSRKIVSVSEMSVSFLQSQEEVCDLLHAAPFQNILPRVHVKGKLMFMYACRRGYAVFLAFFIWAVPHTYPLEQKVSVWMQRWSVWRPNTRHCIWCL